MRFISSLLFIFVVGCFNDEASVKELSKRRLGVDEARNMEAYMSTGGIMKAKLSAPLMLRYQDTSARTVFPETMHVDFFKDSTLGEIQSRMDARYGEYYENRNKVYLRDSVRVTNTTGDTLFCQELWWSQTEQRFYTDKPVRVNRPDMIMIGEGLSAPQDFSYFEMYKISNSVLRVNQ